MARSKYELSVRAKRAGKKEKGEVENIDFSDMPEITDTVRFKRLTGPALNPFVKKQPISLRLNPFVLLKLQTIAAQRSMGYQVLIHQVLEDYANRTSTKSQAAMKRAQK